MATDDSVSLEASRERRFPVWAIVLITMVVTLLVATLVVRYYFWPSPFDAVALTPKEQIQLDNKVARLIPGSKNETHVESGVLEPKAYSEEGASRKVIFSEREINALLAKNTDLADKLAIDLADDLVSARLLFAVDPAFPVMGGKTVRINAGMNLQFDGERPIAILRGVSIMGIPVPNAWLGNLKNIDLVEQFGNQEGFWQSFAAGIDNLSVESGELSIKLAE